MYLQLADWLALICYFGIVIGIGIWSSCQNRGSVDGYFLARRSMHFIPIGASLFASNIGSGHFIGLAGGGASSGIGVGFFETSALPCLLILGWIFLPVYIRAGVSTMPEYIRKRFGGERIRIYLSGLSLMLYIFTKISADLFSGALFIKLSMDLDLYAAIGILLLISALFTIGGGASAVIWTDFIQTLFMIMGAFYLMIVGFINVGGYESMISKYSYSISSSSLYSNTSCGLPNKNYFDLLRSPQSDFPWPGMSFGLFIVIVQRALAAKNLTHARAGCIFAGYLKFLPLFLMVFPGMIGRILFNEQVGCMDPDECRKICNSPSGCSNIAYPKLVIALMPPGARGLMLAVMMAALMSSLTSVFNSSSAIFTMDVWKRFRPSSKDWELMIVGRMFVVALVTISILWIPIIQASQGSRLFDYIQAIQSYLAPPICAIYVLAIFTQRVNEPGAFWGLMIGLTVGMIRFIWQFSYLEPPCTQMHLDTRPKIITEVHYLHFGILLFAITCASAWVISLLTSPIPKENIRRLTYFTVDDPLEPIPICNDFKQTKKIDKTEVNQPDETFHLKIEEPNVIKTFVRPGKFKTALFWLCGIESNLKENFDSSIQVKNEVDTSIDQNKFWSNVCDVNAVVALAMNAFVTAFYNKYD